MQKEMTYEQAKSKLEALCSQRELCEKEVRDRLQKWGMEDGDQEKIIAHLKKEKYVDDIRFATFFVKDKYNLSHWGKSKIVFELRNRRISSDVIEEAIIQIPDEEYSSQLEELLKKKRGSIKKGTPYEIGAKLIRFGISKGYESGLVIKATKKIINTNNNTTDYEDEWNDL